MGTEEDQIPQNAFLIVDGSEIIPLKKALVTIGRMDDNDIVISNAHVSRYHAQMRAMNGRYVLVDLDSTGGTSVNGKRIQQRILHPGDVITLSGIPLLYGRSQGTDKLDEPSGLLPNKSLKSRYPTKGNTDAVDIRSIDQFLEMFDADDHDKNLSEN